jgi:hypothetical protein
MNRRHFLLIATAGMFYYFFPWFGKKTFVDSDFHDSLDVVVGRVKEFFSDPDGAREVGLRYLTLYPNENGTESLMKELANGMGKNSNAGNPDLLKNWLARKIKKDFREDNIVIVDGWVLARTEAQACSITCFS